MLNTTDYLVNRFTTVGIKPIIDAVSYLDGNSWVDEVGGADFDGGSTYHEKFDSVFRGTNTT